MLRPTQTKGVVLTGNNIEATNLGNHITPFITIFIEYDGYKWI